MADSGGRPPGALESWTCWPGSGAVRGRLVVGAVPSPTRLPISFAESSYAVRLNVPELCKDCGGGRSDAAKHARPGPELWKTVRRAYSARERRARAPRTSAAHALAQVSRQAPFGTWMSGAPAPRRLGRLLAGTCRSAGGMHAERGCRDDTCLSNRVGGCGACRLLYLSWLLSDGGLLEAAPSLLLFIRRLIGQHGDVPSLRAGVLAAVPGERPLAGGKRGGSTCSSITLTGRERLMP